MSDPPSEIARIAETTIRAEIASAMVNDIPYIVADFAFKTIVDISPEACSILGYTRDELRNKPIRELLPEAVAERHDQDIEQWAKDPQRRIMGDHPNAYVRKKDGTLIQLALGLHPLRSLPGYAWIPMVEVSYRGGKK
jgi:two-component system sensor kinase FixL